MKFLPRMIVAALALVATSCASSVYNTRSTYPSQGYSAANFNGEWRLVTTGSDYGRSWMNERSNYDNDYGTSDRNRTRYGAWFLPDVFRIDADQDVFRIEDENGTLIADLPMEGAYRYGTYRDQGSYDNNDVRAHWISDRQLQVDRTGYSGRTVTQTFTLENRSRDLRVVTVVDRDGSTRQFTRLYHHYRV